MNKMHLPAKPENEGARLLVWWLHRRQTSVSSALSVLHAQAAVREALVDRLVSGEVIPGGDMGHRIWLATDGKVPTRAWRQRPSGGWFDRPTQFQEQEARDPSPAVARAGEAFYPLGASPAPVHAVPA